VPEGLEVEIYRRAARAVIGRRIVSVTADERCAGPGLEAVVGEVVESVDRVGKQLVIETSGLPLGLHFGMTGRLIVDDAAPIERLEYASARDEPQWDRLVLTFDPPVGSPGGGGRRGKSRGAVAGVLRVNDPRRWSRAELEPDVDRLGPDLLDITSEELATALARRRAPLKAVLLDQHAIAGLGNLCVDEVLWHAGLAPDMAACEVREVGVARLHAVMAEELPAMLERGGSHTGTIDPSVRSELPPCPRDGAPLRRSKVAGRTTVWCPVHQGVGDSIPRRSVP